ncbi:GNAT family N-acetyltransferase [Kitasatospora sp. NPDC101176]|uniref:GNAT family N-acetyltransferase n=1 Tax=Kitasatospora sp. NPDC101176 TaxID=3364099 RepID=UPI0037F3D6D7
MSSPELERINAFLSTFARRQARRTVDVPGGFAVFDDDFALSYANNRLVVDGTLRTVAPGALPALADEVLGGLPYRVVSVLDDEVARACAQPLAGAGYSHSRYLVMLHTGPVPRAVRSAREVGLGELWEPVGRSWGRFLPDADGELLRQLVERRAARPRGAAVVRFLASLADDGEVASWADLYLDPAAGVAQVEDLVTAGAHLRRGHADAVLATALRMAADAGCTTRFLTADAQDWPRGWYGRRGFTPIGHHHAFQRT